MSVKNSYEVVMIFSVANGEEAAQGLYEKFKGMIETNGTLGSVDEWGKRKLAYLINDEEDGYYYVVEFESEPTFPAELERVSKITEGVLRMMVIRK